MNLSLSYITMVIGILSAKCLGFLREVVVAQKFGLSQLTDIYFQIFSVANVVFAALGVALSTFVVKSINLCKDDFESEKKFVASFYKKALKWSLAGLVLLSFLGYPITKLLLQGLSREDFSVALRLYYIMIPSFIFIVLAYTSSGILQNKGKFFRTAVMSFPFNIIIIGGLLGGIDSIYSFGVITTVGWASQFLFLLPSVLKCGYSLNIAIKDIVTDNEKENKRVNISEIAFIFVSNVIFSFLFITDKSFASYKESASSSIHYASNLFTTVSSVFVVGMSAVFFPSLTKSLAQKDDEKTASLIRYVLLFMLCIFIPFLMITSFYNREIIRLVYERGSFDSKATSVVSKAFFAYAFCIFGYISQELLFKVFYAKGKYKITVISSALVVFVNILFNFIFKDSFNMIIYSTPVISIIFALFIFVLLGKEIKNIYNKQFFLNVLKILICAVPFPIFYFLMENLAEKNKLMFVIPIVISAIIYFVMLYVFKILQLILKRN